MFIAGNILRVSRIGEANLLGQNALRTVFSMENSPKSERERE